MCVHAHEYIQCVNNKKCLCILCNDNIYKYKYIHTPYIMCVYIEIYMNKYMYIINIHICNI